MMNEGMKKPGIWVPGNDAVHVEVLCGQGISTVVVSYKREDGMILYPTGLAIPAYQWDSIRERPKGHYAGAAAAFKVILETVERVKAQIDSYSKTKEVVYTYQTVLATARKDDKGYCPVWIRRQSDGQSSVMDTGIRLRKEDWDVSAGLPSLKAHNGGFLRQEVLRIVQGLRESGSCPWDAPGVCVFPYSGQPLEDGRWPVYVLMTENYKQALFRSTGVYLYPEEWDYQTGLPLRSCKLYEVWRKRIEDVYSECVEGRQHQLSFAAKDQVMPVTDKGIPTWVGPYFHYLMDAMEKNHQYGNRRVYGTALNVLKAVCGSLDFPFSSLSLNVLRKIELKLRDDGLRETTISNLFRTIRAVYNRAIKDKIASNEDYPFDQFQMCRFDLSTAHRALSKDDIQRIITYKIQPDDVPEMELAVDLFTFAYFCAGMPFFDLCNLRESNINGGILTYERQKTHLPIRVAVPEQASAIVSKYRSQSKGYIFPILNEQVHKTDLQIRNCVRLNLQSINAALRRLGDKLGLPLKLTTYVARHSFASVLKEEGIPVATISELMGHQDPKTTQIYLDGFSVNHMANAQELLLDRPETDL